MTEQYSKTTRKTVYSVIRKSAKIADGPLTVVDNIVYVFDLLDTFQGEKNPNWQAQVRAGYNATTSCSGTQNTVSLTPSTQELEFLHYNGHKEYYVEQGHLARDFIYQPSNSPDPSVDDSASNVALTKFLKKCKDKQRQFQSGVFLGELRQTLDLIRHPLKGLRGLVDTYVKNCRSGRNLPKKRLAKHLSSQWLEFQFGALPLASDVESAAEALARLRDKLSLKTVRVIHSSTVQRSAQSYVVNGLAGQFRVEVANSYTYSRFIRGAVRCKSMGREATISQAFGAGTEDFLPTVYNLIPYSFLVDYFTNLGDIIETWSFCQADLAWHCDTNKRQGLVTVNTYANPVYSLPNDFKLIRASFVPSQSFWRYSAFSRSSPILGTPYLAFKLPGTGTKWLNIAALASSRVL